MSSLHGPEDPELDVLGVIHALERTCELEAKLRQAIQDTHPLSTSMDWDFSAADREREALLAISEQLEYLEDKLREYRFLSSSSRDRDTRAVVLSQLDGVRRDLVQAIERFMPKIVFGKEAVREVLHFARIGEEPSDTASLPPSPSCLFASTSAALRASLVSPTLRATHQHQQHQSPANTTTSPTTLSQSLAGIIPGGDRERLSAEPSSSSSLMIPGAIGTTASYDSSMADPWLEDENQQSQHPYDAIRTYNANNNNYSNVSGTNVLGERRMYTSSKYGRAPLPDIKDEDIYGPMVVPGGGGKGGKNGKTTTLPPSEQKRRQEAAPGGVVRVRNMLEKAERSLSAVASDREQRRAPAPPRILGATEGRVDGFGCPVVAEADWETALDDSISTISEWTAPGGGNNNNNNANNNAAGGDGGGGGATPVPSWRIAAEPPVLGSDKAPSSIGRGGMDRSAMSTPTATPGRDNGNNNNGKSKKRGGGGNAKSNTNSNVGDGCDVDNSTGSSNNNNGLPGLVGKLAGFAFVLGSIAAAALVAVNSPFPSSSSPHHKNGDNKKKGASSSSSSSRLQSAGRDLPPWRGLRDVDNNTNGKENNKNKNKNAASRSTKPSSPSRNSNSKSTQKQRSGLGGRDDDNNNTKGGVSTPSTVTGPVMNVRPPPSGNQHFPMTPGPDVGIAMG